MESPVRICIGVALVVKLLLLCNAPVDAVALPNEITSTTVKDDRSSRYKTNTTWPARTKSRTPDIALNELTAKESTSEEHTEKNAKYKDRGRVKFGSRVKTSTGSPKRNRATSSTETATLVIVTPTPEVKKPAQIIDSMRNYKKTKMPTLSSTTPVSVKATQNNDDKENDEDESFEKFASDKYHDNFFTIPSFDDDHDFSKESDNDSSNNKVKKDSKSSSYDFPNYSKESFNFKEDTEPFKSSFFDFESELTTPKNDFFDKKYHKISSSIIKHLDSIKAKSPPPNANVHKIVKENMGLERLSNNTPSNKSSVYFKNTKEIRLSDNEGADSVNKELSDVQGTSIYYEMSVLSTETYTVNHSNEDDCDETSPLETTSSPKYKISALKATPPTNAEPTEPTNVEAKSEVLSTLSSNSVPVTNIIPYFSTVHSIPYSTQSSISSTERIPNLFSNYRNRSYSKRLNFTGSKDSPNSVTPKPEGTLTVRPQTRKFHYTTPRTKPVWMSPTRNVARVSSKPVYTSPKTIYYEHFSIKDKFPTSKPVQPSKTILTTISSSEIDPVLQTDISGTSKVVYSQFVTDNTIPSLRKRGSMRFKASTASSAEVESDLRDLEMPSTAWALASLISPPSLPNTVVNASENELQKVGEAIDKIETSARSTTTSTVSPISNDIITKVTEVDQNKAQWPPLYAPTTPNDDNKITTEVKERLPAESNISLQSSAEPVTTEAAKGNTLDAEIKSKEIKPLWIPAPVEQTTTSIKHENDVNYETNNETIPPIDATRSTGFESITKLPASVTTPQDETVASSEVNQTVTNEKSNLTTDYEITTIRFSYVPTEAVEDVTSTITETTTEGLWNSIVPTRTKATTIEDSPITTYRPKYMTTTEIEETTTIVPDTTPVLEISSQIIANVTEQTLETTESTVQTTEAITEATVDVTTDTIAVPITTPIPTTTEKVTTEAPTDIPTTEITEDTTTTVVEVITEINTEKSTLITVLSTETVTSSEKEIVSTSTSEENSHSNEINYEIKTQEPTVKPDTTSTTIAATVIEKDSTETMKETTTVKIDTDETTTEDESRAVNELEDLTSYAGAITTSVPPGPDEAGSGAAVAIAVSTIGVIALVLLIGLLLVVRRRGRRGVYAQRCTPVSLDAYSLDSVSVGHRKGNHRLRASKRSYGNPAYDDEVTSHPMQYPALASFALDVDSMTAEFAEIPSVSVKGEEVPPGCEDKNRYSNVLPLPETRVPLQRLNNDPTTEYINANYVTGPGNIRNYYILAQAPLSNTVVDFWRMVWEQNSRLLIMLTEYMENGVEKCYEYLPPSEISDNKRTFGDFKVILKKREQRDKYAVSSIQLINMATRTWREVSHLWYFWPAKGVPEDYDSVIDFLFEMRSYMKVAQTAKEYDEEGVEVIYGDQNRSSFNNLSKLRDDNGSSNGVNVYSPARAEEQMRRANNGTLSRMKAASEVEGIRPCIVSCASGAGRSGALAALDVAARALGGGGAGADVPRTVRCLRTMRAHALSNRHHYIWLYKVLSEYGNKIMGSGDNI